MIWMTCQPKARLDRRRSRRAVGPAARMAALNAGRSGCPCRSTAACRRSRRAPGRASRRSRCGRSSRTASGSALSFGVGRLGHRLRRSPRPGRRPGASRRWPCGSSFGAYRMWRTLIAVRRAGRLVVLDVDLLDVTLRAGGRWPRRRSCPGASSDDIGGDDGAVLGDVDAVVDDLGLVGGVDRRGGDLGDAADPVDPVVALDDRGRRVDRGREEGRQERLVGRACRRPRPAEVAALRRGRGIGRDGLGDVLPRLAALEVLERLLGLGLGGRLLGVGRLGRAVVDSGATAMTQAWRPRAWSPRRRAWRRYRRRLTVTPSSAASLAWSWRR